MIITIAVSIPGAVLLVASAPLFGVVLRVEEVVSTSEGGAGLLPVARDGEADLERNLWLALKGLRGEGFADGQGSRVGHGDGAQRDNGVARRGLGGEEEVGGRVVDPFDPVDVAEMGLDVGFDVRGVQGVDAPDVNLVGDQDLGVVGRGGLIVGDLTRLFWFVRLLMMGVNSDCRGGRQSGSVLPGCHRDRDRQRARRGPCRRRRPSRYRDPWW